MLYEKFRELLGYPYSQESYNVTRKSKRDMHKNFLDWAISSQAST